MQPGKRQLITSLSQHLSPTLWVAMMLFSLFLTQELTAQKTILHCGQLLNAENDGWLSEMSIVVEGNKITAIERGYINGDNGKEFGYMVAAGMPALEAIQSATLAPAQILGVSTQLGTLETGKLADIIAVPGNPEEDIEMMTKVSFVMKDGKVFKQPLR